MDKCNCYHEDYNKQECWGTKEREECSCNGDESKCDFYPEKRAAAQARKVTEKFNKNKNLETLKNVIHCLKMGAELAVCEDCNLYPCDHTDVKDLAIVGIEVLEKQVPKKVVSYSDDESDYVYCPCCHECIGSNEMVWEDFYYRGWSPMHCQECGQAMIWE